MATVDDQLTPEEREREREKVHVDLERIAAASSTFTVKPAKAAFFLSISEKELEHRRGRREPPPPHPNWVAGQKGVPVFYFVRTLVEYIRGEPISQKNPYGDPMQGSSLAANAIAANAAAAARERKARSMKVPMRWNGSTSIEADETIEPFFVDASNRVKMHCWEDYTKTSDYFFSESIDIEWMEWDDALARVWEDEGRRLQWLGKSDVLAPGLLEVVEAKRKFMFSKI
jgi:hypothetical protein